MSKIISIVFIVLSLLFSGCASIVSKSQYPVTINSNPGGATVTVKNKQGMEIHKATTPATMTLDASAGFFSPASYSFEFQKEGYYPGSTSLSAGVDGWYIGNILFGGLIGLIIVDPATGAMYKLDNAVYGNLSPDSNFQTATPPEVKNSYISTKETSSDISDQLIRLKELKESGILTDEEYESKRKALVNEL